jgi:hypothetical protein
MLFAITCVVVSKRSPVKLLDSVERIDKLYFSNSDDTGDCVHVELPGCSSTLQPLNYLGMWVNLCVKY